MNYDQPGVPPEPGGRTTRSVTRIDWNRLTRGFMRYSILIFLVALSWYATYFGISQLLLANTGDLTGNEDIFVKASTLALMIMILYIVHRFADPNPRWLSVVFILSYAFLTGISVGFGFGFYWQTLRASGVEKSDARDIITLVQSELDVGKEALRDVSERLDSLEAYSKARAEEEKREGGTCDDDRSGEGPRMRLRDSDAETLATDAKTINAKIATVEGHLGELDKAFRSIADGPRERGRGIGNQEADQASDVFYANLNNNVQRKVRGFNALRDDPYLIEMKERFRGRANRTVFPDGKGGTFNCPDAKLKTDLLSAINAMDRIQTISVPAIVSYSQGSGVTDALNRLWSSAKNLMPHWDGQPADRAPGLEPDDIVPFVLALAVDLCILLLAIDRPYAPWSYAKRQIHLRQDDAISQAVSRLDESFTAEELFARYTVKFLGNYYVAIPVRLIDEDDELNSDAPVALAFAAMEDLGLFSEVRMPLFMRLRKKLAAKGRTLKGRPSFTVYRMRRHVIPQLLRSSLGKSSVINQQASSGARRSSARSRTSSAGGSGAGTTAPGTSGPNQKREEARPSGPGTSGKGKSGETRTTHEKGETQRQEARSGSAREEDIDEGP